jgi:hypothetical protein
MYTAALAVTAAATPYCQGDRLSLKHPHLAKWRKNKFIDSVADSLDQAGCGVSHLKGGGCVPATYVTMLPKPALQQ